MNRKQRSTPQQVHIPVFAALRSQSVLNIRLRLALLFVIAFLPFDGWSMPPGWAKGCLKPTYGSPAAACSTLLNDFVTSFVANIELGFCQGIGSNGSPAGFVTLCADCPKGYAADHNQCIPVPGFEGPDPYADVGSQGQPADAPNRPEMDPLGGGDSCPGGDPILVGDPALVGNPINARSGNKYQREIDYAGAGVFRLSFVRHYNSRFTFQSQLGLGWRHNYDRQIMVEDPARVVLVRANGQAVEFKLAGGVWSSAIDVTNKLRSTSGGWQLTSAADEIETYDTGGRLISIANRAGLTQTLSYSTPDTPRNVAPRSGLLLSVSDPAGRQLKFTYDTHFRIRTMTDPAGKVFAYGYFDNPDVLTTVTYPGEQNATRTYLYAFARINPVLANALTGIVDENGQTFATYTYDPGTGRATGSSHGGALAADPYTLTYNINGTTSVADANVSRTYNFQTIRGIARVTGINQPCSTCGSSSLAVRTYDSNGFAASGSDFNGNVTIHQRNDPFGRVDLETSRTEAAGRPEARTTTTEWDPAVRLIRRIAEPLRITTIIYDAHANVQTRTIQATTDTNGALGFAASLTGKPRTWNYAYTYSESIPGQVARLVIDGPRTDVADSTTYDWDVSGNLTSVTNALGHTTRLGNYDSNGRPQQIIDPNGLAITLSYDARGRLIARNVGGELTSYDYDAVGQLRTLTLPDGSSLSYTYDAAHRLTQIQDNLGDQISYTLDAMGNRIQEQVFDPNGVVARRHTREFNALSRLAKDIGATDPANQITLYVYDNQGNVVSTSDPLGHVTTSVYDALNRVAKVIDPAAIGSGAGASTLYSYDGADQLTQLTDPRGLATAYTLDGLGNLMATASPDTGVAHSNHDEAGNLSAQADARGVVSSFAYDALNRITRVDYTAPAGSGLAPVTIVYSYDDGAFALGRLTGIADFSGSISYAYDVHGRLVSDVRTIGNITFATAYRYDAAGRLAGMTYPSGRTVDYTLDASGRVGQIDTTDQSVSQSIVGNVAYQPFGPVTSFTYGNAQKATRQCDLDGRITGYSLGALSRGVSYDADSRISAFKHLTPVLDQTFGYDNVDRLTAWSTAATSQSFAYDAVGNRTNQTVGNSNYAFTYSGTSNRLTRSEFPIGFNHQYDAVGNTIQDALRNYTYDARSRLTRIVAGGLTIQFVVNGLGQRVSKAPSNGLARVFNYDLAGHLIAESTPAGEVLREYVYLGDLPVALISNDHDDDGVPDARDNCVLDANPDQRDNSGGGYGNVCNGDANGDGLLSQADLLVTVLLVHRGPPNPAAAKRADMNGDGVLNYQDEALLSQRIRQHGVLGPSGRRGQAAGPEIFYVYTDQIGAPRMLVDAVNVARWRWDASDPFGIQPADATPQGDFISLPFNLRFPGQYYDRESGLHYNGFRDYDSSIGRYIESDPVGLAAGVNTYTYALGNPNKWTDPDGLDILVCYYPEGVGHVGFGNATEMATWGFYPKTHKPVNPGVIKADPYEPGTKCKTLPAKPEQDNCMQKCQDRRRNEPGNYYVIGRQCTSFVRDCLAECGLPSGNASGPRPGPWFNSLPR